MTELYISHQLDNHFMNSLEPLIKECLIEENSVEFKLLFLDRF